MCRYAECRDLLIVMLNVIMLSVVMLSVVVQNDGAPFVPFLLKMAFKHCSVIRRQILQRTLRTDSGDAKSIGSRPQRFPHLLHRQDHQGKDTPGKPY